MAGEVYLAGSVRTPIGGFCGTLSEVAAPRLGAAVVQETLRRAGVAAEAVDEVVVGNVIGAGLGQNVARQASIGAGLPSSVGATTVNKVCGSGLKSVMMGVQAIHCGDAGVVVAGGCENMSQAPYLLRKARTGYRMGHGEVTDAMICDGLWDVYHDLHMGMFGDRCAEKYGFSRSEQDDFAVASYQRALQSQQEGKFAAEITPIEIAGRKGTVTVEVDEEPTRFQEDKLRSLRPAFGKEGSVTAGNASSVNDGAAAVVVVSAAKREELGISPEARVVGYASYAREPEWFTLAPVGAVQRLIERIDWRLDEVDLFEVNEAFSIVPMALMKDLQIPHEKVNVHGGAVALGHPIGASGTRVLVTLLGAMKDRGARRGIATLCIGGGEGVAIAVEAC